MLTIVLFGPIISLTNAALLTRPAEAIMKSLQERVRDLRNRRGWTQEDLAREMEVSLSTVQRWENRGGEPTRLARRELRRLFREAGVADID
jgi:ribosome-binding protein aMBF1 (putative translation factor)